MPLSGSIPVKLFRWMSKSTTLLIALVPPSGSVPFNPFPQIKKLTTLRKHPCRPQEAPMFTTQSQCPECSPYYMSHRHTLQGSSCTDAMLSAWETTGARINRASSTSPPTKTPLTRPTLKNV
eukprot:221980-Amphidinium_carterae.1